MSISKRNGYAIAAGLFIAIAIASAVRGDILPAIACFLVAVGCRVKVHQLDQQTNA